MARPTKKRKISQPGDAQSESRETKTIATSRDLQDILADYTGADIRQSRDFLNKCSTGPEVEETEATRNRAILREYLEAQCKNGGNEETEGEGASGAFADVASMWAYAFQKNSQHVLTMVPATLAILVRLCSHNEDLRSHGTILVKSLLRQAILKIIYRSLTGTKDHHISPCLRLLTEMNRFDFGALCGTVHSTFDFSIKDLAKNFEVRGSTKVEVEDPARPSIRTLAVRFFLSFLQNGEPHLRNEILGLRTWVTPIFKHLKQDVSSLVSELLECLERRVVVEKEIPRATKTNLFNEWVLGHIVSLYSREETVKISRAGKDDQKCLPELAHNFLLAVCTTLGNGVRFADQGWYPPGYLESEGKRRGGHKVYNRALSSFAGAVRPYTDTLQLDLLLAIFKTSPELVADYFTSRTAGAFGFDPKLTSTWIGYCTFLCAVISLPVPGNFGTTGIPTIPPPAEVVVENILPKPLSKPIMLKCLIHENTLIRFFTTRLLITAFQKFKQVLNAIDQISASLHNPSDAWLKFRLSVVEEFCSRIPGVSHCAGALGSGRAASIGFLQSEAQAKLLAEYYSNVPEVALTAKIDIHNTLLNALDDQTEGDGKKGFKALEVGHLLRVAAEIPDPKWWNKTQSMKHSPFVAVLKHCCQSVIKPRKEIRMLLYSFTSTSQLFQDETAASPLDALLDSLTSVMDDTSLEAVLSLLNESVNRCVRNAFKYLDKFTEIAMGLEKGKKGPVYVAPVSPLIMAVAEQYAFVEKSKELSDKHKLDCALWLQRLLDASTLVGENGAVLAVVCDEIAHGTDSPTRQNVFLHSRDMLRNRPESTLSEAGGRELAGGRLLTSENIISVNSVALKRQYEEMENGSMEVSIFRLAALHRATEDVVEAGDMVLPVALAYVDFIGEIIKYTALRLINDQDNVVVGRTAKYMALQCKFFEILQDLDQPPLCFLCIKAFSDYIKLLQSNRQFMSMVFQIEKRTFLNAAVGVVHAYGVLGDEADAELRKRDLMTICDLDLDDGDIEFLIDAVLSSDIDEVVVDWFLVMLLAQATEQGSKIKIESINQILELPKAVNELPKAIALYISRADLKDLEGIQFAGAKGAAKGIIDRVLTRKVPAYREPGLRVCENLLASGSSVELCVRLENLVQAYSLHSSETGKYEWDPSATEDDRKRLTKIFDHAQDALLECPFHSGKAEILIRAESLFPSMDRSKILEYISDNRDKSYLTDGLVQLIDVLITGDHDILSAEMRGWFLLSFDHLTRRFAEDPFLDEQVLGFAKALGTFMERKKLPINSIVPRTALNAVLEAGLLKHIDVVEVVQFAATIVFVSPPGNLDLAKFLQQTLSHPQNPLSHRSFTSDSSELLLSLAYLISQMLNSSKSTIYNLATLDTLLEFYRGTDTPIDALLLSFISACEAHLARSVASRISAWNVATSDEVPLISRIRGKLTVTINSRVLLKSALNFQPILTHPSSSTAASLGAYLDAIREAPVSGGKSYDPHFLLPIMTYGLQTDKFTIRSLIDSHAVSYTLVALSHSSASIQSMTRQLLALAITKLTTSTSVRTKTQLLHHLRSTLSSLPPCPNPIPTVLAAFLAQAFTVLNSPAHLLYSKLMNHFLSSPLLDLSDLPFILSLISIDTEHHHREVSWVLSILAAGIKTTGDLELYRRRNVVNVVLSLGVGPARRVLEILWNVCGVEGGATMMVTRCGILAWIRQQLCEAGRSEEVKVQVKRLAGRVWEACAKGYVNEWSHGGALEDLKDMMKM